MSSRDDVDKSLDPRDEDRYQDDSKESRRVLQAPGSERERKSDSTAPIPWQDALMYSIGNVDFHMNKIERLCKMPEVKKELKAEHFRDGAAPLHLAAACGRTEIMEQLLEAGADINSYASGLGSWLTPLHHASLNNQLEAAKLLIEKGARKDDVGFQDAMKGNAIDFAKSEGHMKMLDILKNTKSKADSGGQRDYRGYEHRKNQYGRGFR